MCKMRCFYYSNRSFRNSLSDPRGSGGPAKVVPWSAVWSPTSTCAGVRDYVSFTNSLKQHVCETMFILTHWKKCLVYRIVVGSCVIRKHIAWYLFRVIHLYKVQCLVWCWDPVFLKVYFKVWFQDPVFPENILPGMISGSFVIKDYTVYLRPCPCISLMKALECVSASPGQILQLWCLQPKWLSQQIPPRKWPIL